MRISCAAAAFLVLLSFPASHSAQQQGSIVSAGELYRSASPSVVLIETYGFDGKVSGSGSGFIVSPDGAILTNYHVIAHTKRASVRLANEDAYDDVSVLDLDKRKDIALVKIKAVALPTLRLGHSNAVQIGDKLYALGSPLGGFFQNSLSEGILSGIRQADGYKFFQLSTPVSHGSSGSPVFDARGDVIGIIEASIEEGQNINLAIPIDYAVGMLSSRSPHPLESIYEPEESKSGESTGADSSAQPAKTVARTPDALRSSPFDYLAGKIGVWTKHDADMEFGDSYSRRDALTGASVTGDIFRYDSPTTTLESVELYFNRESGRLFAAYLYPRNVVSWESVREALGRHYTKKKGLNGTMFYIYQIQQRARAVLVDSQGNVTNFGIW